MDTKKNRNKKKKGKQGKNVSDVSSNAGEVAPQCHNHESTPKDHQSGSDADDPMLSVGHGDTKYQNNKPTPQANHETTKADGTLSYAGEEILGYQKHEPAMTQEDHKVSSTVRADQKSAGMSETGIEFDMHKFFEAKLDKLHETIKQSEDEKSIWLQKASMMESELEKLHKEVGSHTQNKVFLEERLNNLQNGYDVLVTKEEVLDGKVKCIEDATNTLSHQETSFKERFHVLEETNMALQVQVKVLDEALKNTTKENQRLVKSFDELESRLQVLEVKAAHTEASTTEEVKVPENQVMDQTDLTNVPIHKQTTGFADIISEGNTLIANNGLSSSRAITSVINYNHISNSPGNCYASNHLDETLIQHLEKARDIIDVNAHQKSKQGFDEPKTSEEIVPVLLDDIQIHEDNQQISADDETAEVPFSDAPIVGAPFRLISFVARYVSGADLVNQK